MKALDIVITPGGGIAIIKETNNNGKQASIDYINELNPNQEHNAWWFEKDLKVIDSLPNILAKAMAHPFGDGKKDVEIFFKIN